MLLRPNYYTSPFPFFTVTSAFAETQCLALERLFLVAEDWQHRDGVFYRCSLKDVTASVSASFQGEVLARMRELTGLPLVNCVAVTAQKMRAAQAIGIHSDRPQLGYEVARLVVQLNRHWQPDHGGVLELFASPEGESVCRIEPRYNHAFGFLLHTDSYHGVTEVTQPRQTIVFNFWHAANTPELATYVRALLLNVHFSELPAALDSVATEAEQNLSEEVTCRASTAAIVLLRWGYNDATIVIGYQHSAGVSICAAAGEVYVAVLLADWIAGLYRDSFDLAGWHRLQSALDGLEVPSRLSSVWQLCLPELN